MRLLTACSCTADFILGCFHVEAADMSTLQLLKVDFCNPAVMHQLPRKCSCRRALFSNVSIHPLDVLFEWF